MELQSVANAYHSLIAAIIERAIADLKEAGLRCRDIEKDRAMAFILSDTCEAYCLELEIDIEAVREKGAALYRKIIAEEKPRRRRNANAPGKLPGGRAIAKSEIHSFKKQILEISPKENPKQAALKKAAVIPSKKKAVQRPVVYKGQSGARRSPCSASSVR